MRPELTIIIPTYNRSDLLRECIESLRVQTYQSFELIVVSDGGKENLSGIVKNADGTTTYLMRDSITIVTTRCWNWFRWRWEQVAGPKAYEGMIRQIPYAFAETAVEPNTELPESAPETLPSFAIRELDANHGFAVAINEGLQYPEGNWVLLLNDDMTLAPDALEQLMNAARAGKADMLAPLVLWRDSPDTIYSAGDRIGPGGRPEAIGFRAPRDGFAMPDRIFGVSGGAGLFRRAVFERVGVLCEDFVAYFEDADLCFRARMAGFSAALVPEAVLWHVGSASIQGATWKRAQHCCRNHALLVVRNYPLPLLLRWAPQIVAERAHQLRMAFTSARAAFGAARALRIVAATEWSLLQRMPRALFSRQYIQPMRTISVEALRALIEEPRA